MSDARWYFTEEQLANSPSRKCGINAEQELSYRQRSANLIQEMGQRLQVSQLCINTAIVYMHRFYAFHSFSLFHRNSIAAAAFFLAAKVEEQPRKLEHVIKILNICLEKTDARETYAEQAQELVFNENVLLQTLGFDVAIDHPHTHVVRACNLFNIVQVSRELRQTCYFMASNSLHLTTMCLKYRPTVVAAFCIYIACKWSRWEIPDSSEGKAWYGYVDENVTTDILKKLTDEYLQILERSPSKFKSKMKAITSNGQAGINHNPSMNSRDETPSASSHHKGQHDKHHHHHHNRNNAGSSSNSVANRKQPVEVGASSSSTSKQPQTQSQTSSNYKSSSSVPASSSSHLQRPRPPSTSSSSSNLQQPPYTGNSTSDATQKPVNEERTQHRQMQQENPSFTNLPRQIDPQRQRMNSSQAPPNIAANSSAQQQSNQIQSHQKPANTDQRHAQPMSSKPPDYHQKNMKPHQPSGSEFQNRSSSHSQQPPQSQPQQQHQHKKPTWPQQQPSQHQTNTQKPSQSHTQSSHSQPNLSTSNNSNRSSSQALPTYNESTKQSASASQQPSAQNDFWFNDKILENTTKAVSPLRPLKSMFSPSPEHDSFERTKMMMMQAANAKRTDSPKSDKQDRRSNTPSKREKRAEMSTTPTSQKKQAIPKLENAVVPPLIPDVKKRPFSAVDELGDFNRESKSRKLEPVKSEPSSIVSGAMKQPIETNPDIVKSLLKECYTTSKFDSFGMDSPLDVINPDPAQTQPIMASSFQQAVKAEDSILVKQEPRDNGYGDEHHKRSKSKKKKDKHKHKKEHKRKSHKSDREERSDRSLKLILPKDKSDAKSSPESIHTGHLKIKIPIKDVNKTDLVQGPPLPPAPIKLKISKDKIGGFNNSSQSLNDDGSSSSTSHKKKDKDRSKSKSSKHGNNNKSEFKDAGYQQQQQPIMINKMNPQVTMQQQQQQPQLNAQAQNPFDVSSVFSDSSFSQQGFFNQMVNSNQEYHNFGDFFHNSNVNYSNLNSSSNGSHKK